jgi:hypothetical protein
VLIHGSHSATHIMSSSMAGVRAVRGRPAFTCAVKVTLPFLRRCCSSSRNINVWMTLTIAHNPVQQYQLDYYRYRGLGACRSIHRACVFHDLSIRTDPCCALCVLSTPNTALYIVVTTQLRSVLLHFACISKTKRLIIYVV